MVAPEVQARGQQAEDAQLAAGNHPPAVDAEQARFKDIKERLHGAFEKAPNDVKLMVQHGLQTLNATDPVTIKNMIATTFQGHPDLIKQAEVALGAYLGSTDGLLSAQTIQNMEAINAQILGNFTGASHK